VNSILAAVEEIPLVLARKETGKSAPSVTVTVTLYNYRDFVIPCLDSAKRQTLGKFDLIVVDDCSSDNSAGVVSDWLDKNGSRFESFQLLQHRRNLGLANARNTGFGHARTDFVFVLDADNLIYPRCLQCLLSALQNCDASFAYCYLEKFGEVSGLQNTRPWNPHVLQHGNYIDAMVLHRKAVWQMVGGYATDMPVMGWEDFDLWFRIAKVGGWGVQIPEILARYRVSRKSMLQMITNTKVQKLWSYLRAKHPEFFWV
jgi:glycosyltransferase involved in cell wall biosynthesis